MALGKQFENLTTEKQWEFVLGLEDKSKIEVYLDNDSTEITFGDEFENGDEDDPVLYFFQDFIGDAEGVLHLLKALGISANRV